MEPTREKTCVPCTTGQPPLKGQALREFYLQLAEGWEIRDEHHLEKTYLFSNFKKALAYVNEIGVIAEEEGHHPDIFLAWGVVKITLWTHKIKGLSESDFIMASKCEVAYQAHLE